jgi:DNA-binding MarR family transcriptional regulator
MNAISVERTGQRGRPVARVTIRGAKVSILAARLYATLAADTSAQHASNGELATLVGVHPYTVIHALAALENAGLVVRRYGRLGRLVELVTP